MKQSQYKRWRGLLHRAIVKEQTKRKHTHPACLHAVEKYEKVENINTQNDYEKTSKNSTDKKKSRLVPCALQMRLNSKKTSSRLFKRISRK